jgi:hypothetical protein
MECQAAVAAEILNLRGKLVNGMNGICCRIAKYQNAFKVGLYRLQSLGSKMDKQKKEKNET